jgi:hypothetical protein
LESDWSGRRRRFVQDGEVVVENARPRGRAPAPDPLAERRHEDRVAALESELASERNRRIGLEDEARRMRDTLRDLQTRLAHAELARGEAQRAAAETMAELAARRAEIAVLQERLRLSDAPRRAARPGPGAEAEREPAAAGHAAGGPEPVRWWVAAEKRGWRAE